MHEKHARKRAGPWSPPSGGGGRGPAEKERARNWEERKQQSNWAQSRPTHGSETSPNRTHNNTQGTHEVRAPQQPPNATHAERAISKHPPPLPLQGAHVLHKGGNCALRAGRCPPRGWQQGRDQPTGNGTVHVVRRCEILVQGGRRGGGGARQGHPGAPTDRGRSNTDTQNVGATPGGTRASTADKEEGHSKAGEATGTAGTGNQNGADGRARAWEAATIKGMAWPASPFATGCQGNPCSTSIRWGCLPQPRWAVCATVGAHRGRPALRGKRTYGARPGQRVEEQGTWASRTQKHSEAGYGRPVDRRVDGKNSRTTPATTSTSSIRQLLGAADTQTAHHATFSTAPTHQLLGFANAETTSARAPAAAADRKQRPDATCEGKNG